MSNRRSIDVREGDDIIESDTFEVAGAFNRAAHTFRVVRVPTPPEARRVKSEDFARDRVTTGWELALGCPKCHEDISFVFVGQVMSGYEHRRREADKEEMQRLREENSAMRRQLGIPVDGSFAPAFVELVLPDPDPGKKYG